MRLNLEKKHFIIDDVRVTQLLDVHEIVFEKENVLPIQVQHLHCKQLFPLFAIAFFHYSMRTFSNLLSHVILILEERGVFLRLIIAFRIHSAY